MEQAIKINIINNSNFEFLINNNTKKKKDKNQNKINFYISSCLKNTKTKIKHTNILPAKFKFISFHSLLIDE